MKLMAMMALCEEKIRSVMCSTDIQRLFVKIMLHDSAKHPSFLNAVSTS